MIKTIQDYSYKINQNIGKGYSSTVHKGVNDKTGQQVSIKVIQMSKLQDPINQMLLQYQVSALKSLTHSPNCLHLFQVYATKNNTYIITELCQGDLGTLIKQKKQYHYYEAVEILQQIISGYMDIYKQGYLHRDIKPANIFYKGNNFKIGDFGFAIPVKDLKEHKHYNVGSPVYMPPQALKENIYSISCDTWAIGVIFFQLLKGVVPWRAISQQKLYDKIMTEPLSQLTLGLPQVARTFLGKILNLDINNRITPQQLASWPAKLFAVQIKQPLNINVNMVSPLNIQQQQNNNKVPLQQISPFNEQLNRDYNSRSKSYHNNNNMPIKQLPSNIIFPSPINQNKIMINNNRVNFYVNENQKFQRVSIIKGKQNKNPLVIENSNNFNQCQFYANQMLNYLKFIHKIIKFIGHPTECLLKDLQNSLTKHLLKQIQRIQKIKDIQNADSFGVNKWKQYLKSVKYQKFNKKFNKLVSKYKMFHLLPKDQFVLDVYKDQLIFSIEKISLFLQNEQNISNKGLIALDYLVNFYQIFILKQKLQYKQFLSNSGIPKQSQQNEYNVKKQLHCMLKNKILNLNIKSQYNSNIALDTTNFISVNDLKTNNFAYQYGTAKNC